MPHIATWLYQQAAKLSAMLGENYKHGIYSYSGTVAGLRNIMGDPEEGEWITLEQAQRHQEDNV